MGQLTLKTVYATLAPIDKVISLLSAETDISEVSDFAAKCEAAKKIAARDGENRERLAYFGELAIWSKRRLGEMIKQGQEAGLIDAGKSGPGNKKKASDDLTPLKVIDIVPNRDYAHRCKQLASIDEEVVRAYIEKTKEGSGEITSAGCVMNAKSQESLVKSKPNRVPKEVLGVHHCSFEDLEIADESVDLVFTDPPYDRKSLPLYEPMLQIAAKVLVPGGSCLCYCGHLFVPKVVDFGRAAGLRFYWLCAALHRKKASMSRSGIRAGWKPIVWFTKGERFDTSQYVHDCVLEEAEKSDHQWQQPVAEAERFIEALSRKGHLIFDPFCGSGTTSIAARNLGRKWITCDIDADAVAAARGRLS